MVFQDNQLFPHRSTLDNVAFGLKMAGVGRAERHARAAAWLTRVGLDGFGPRKVTELSGGEAKRVALARTLVTEPSVVLLDEPLTGLDRELHDQLVVELAELLHDTDATALLVTHDLDEAAAIADRTVLLDEIQATADDAGRDQRRRHPRPAAAGPARRRSRCCPSSGSATTTPGRSTSGSVTMPERLSRSRPGWHVRTRRSGSSGHPAARDGHRPGAGRMRTRVTTAGRGDRAVSRSWRPVGLGERPRHRGRLLRACRLHRRRRRVRDRRHRAPAPEGASEPRLTAVDRTRR